MESCFPFPPLKIFSIILTKSLIAEAKLVHGINSSVLYEAALIGKDIKVEGNCLLKTHQHQNDKLLAAMVARQFAVSDELFDSNKLRRFSHIKGL